MIYMSLKCPLLFRGDKVYLKYESEQKCVRMSVCACAFVTMYVFVSWFVHMGIRALEYQCAVLCEKDTK
jgi:hypothetical protein